MAIPSANMIAARLLCALDGGQAVLLRDLRAELADRFALSTDERRALVNADSKETKFDNRVGHARTLLVRLGLAEQPGRSALQISAAGVAVLAGDRTPRSGIKNATSAGLYRALDANPDAHPDTAGAASWPNSADVDPELDGQEPDDAALGVDLDAADVQRSSIRSSATASSCIAR